MGVINNFFCQYSSCRFLMESGSPLSLLHEALSIVLPGRHFIFKFLRLKRTCDDTKSFIPVSISRLSEATPPLKILSVMKKLLAPVGSDTSIKCTVPDPKFDATGLYSEGSLTDTKLSSIKLESFNETTPTSCRAVPQGLDSEENGSNCENERNNESASPSFNLTSSSTFYTTQFWRDLGSFSNETGSKENILEHSSSFSKQKGCLKDYKDPSYHTGSSSCNEGNNTSLPVSHLPLSLPVSHLSFSLPVSFPPEHSSHDPNDEDKDLILELLNELDSMSETDVSSFTTPPSSLLSFINDPLFPKTQFLKDLTLSQGMNPNPTNESKDVASCDTTEVPASVFCDCVADLNTQASAAACNVCKGRKGSFHEVSTPSTVPSSLSFELFSPIVHESLCTDATFVSPDLFSYPPQSYTSSCSYGTGACVKVDPTTLMASAVSVAQGSGGSSSVISAYTSTPVFHLQKAPARLSMLPQERGRGIEKRFRKLSLPRKRKCGTVKTGETNGCDKNEITPSNCTKKEKNSGSPDLF